MGEKKNIYEDNCLRITVENEGLCRRRKIEKVDTGEILCICNGTINKVTLCYLHACDLLSRTQKNGKKSKARGPAFIQRFCSRKALKELNMKMLDSDQIGIEDLSDEDEF